MIAVVALCAVVPSTAIIVRIILTVCIVACRALIVIVTVVASYFCIVVAGTNCIGFFNKTAVCTSVELVHCMQRLFARNELVH